MKSQITLRALGAMVGKCGISAAAGPVTSEPMAREMPSLASREPITIPVIPMPQSDKKDLRVPGTCHLLLWVPFMVIEWR